MTAYEFAERMKNYRRENLPLFAPMESEYNGQICEMAFDLLMQAGLLGSPYDIPDSLKGQDIEFKFESPLSESEEEEKRNKYMMVREMLGAAMEIDPGASHEVSISNALRDAIKGIGSPTGWLVPPEIAVQGRQMEAAQQAAMAAAEMSNGQ
jgi:hypothetical protein